MKGSRTFTFLLGVVATATVMGPITATPASAQKKGACSVVSKTWGGLAREYEICLPNVIPVPAALVFVFHGGGGNHTQVKSQTGWDLKGKAEGFITIFPQGCEATRSGKMVCTGDFGKWNADQVPCVGDAECAGIDDEGFVISILADVNRKFRVDPTRIFATGQSKGGMFSYSLACDQSAVFAAISVGSTTVSDSSCSATRNPVAVNAIHGTDDELVKWTCPGETDQLGICAGTEFPPHDTGLFAFATLNGDTVGPTFDEARSGGVTSCYKYTSPAGASMTQYCLVAGAGHLYGAVSVDLNLTDEAWAFFKAHPKR